MRFLVNNHLENAIEALKANRLRTALTIIGVTIGVASMTAALSLAGGATQFINGQIASTKDSVAIVRSNTSTDTKDTIIADPQAIQATTTLTQKDASDLARIPNANVSPLAVLHTSLTAQDGKVDGKNATLIGSNANLITIAKLELKDGQFLADDSGLNGIVMGHQLAIDLFGTEHSLGSVVKVRGQTFTVIGVLKSTNQPINYLGVDFDRSAIIQLDTLKKFTQDVAQIQQIVIHTDKDENMSEIKNQSEKILSKNHLDEKDYAILTGDAITKPTSKFFSSLNITIAIITGISLLVGGIGIMNIMLVNVAERNREVGIRKAIGATDSNIINQFLIESAIVGFLGGVSGYILGISIAFILGLYLPFSLVLQWEVAVISIGVAIVTGIIFGVYPAVMAAKKDPIEALHQ